MSAPKITLSREGVGGFEVAAIRLLRRRQPGTRWRSLRDEPNAAGERRPPTGDDNSVKRAA